ncbi:BICD family-like cargo adapter 1 [Osmerus eperlanus]|uniref:BICD family-like cargo adapter 1 n=1 Tax=Osmerus eperlanus TaxID=29151 RepID=UPI002E11EB45
MKHLLEEFKGLYEERLRRIDFDTKGSTQEEMLRMKLNVLQSYVNDLGDQNQVLIQTVEELEKEANQKVASLEVKLRTSDDVINGLAQQRKDLEERACALLSENEDLRSDVDSLKCLGWLDRHTHILDDSRKVHNTLSLCLLRTVLRDSLGFL